VWPAARRQPRRPSTLHRSARGAVFEDYDFGEDFRTVDGIMTTPAGAKLAWMKDSEGNILGVASM
jgi:hypothetical protein